MQHFQSIKHLLSQVKSDLKPNFTSLLMQHFVKRLPQKIHHHVVIGAFVTILINVRKTKVSSAILTLDVLEDLDLIEQFRLTHGPFLYLDGDFGFVMVVLAFEDLVEGSHAQLLG